MLLIFELGLCLCPTILVSSSSSRYAVLFEDTGIIKKSNLYLYSMLRTFRQVKVLLQVLIHQYALVRYTRKLPVTNEYEGVTLLSSSDVRADRGLNMFDTFSG